MIKEDKSHLSEINPDVTPTDVLKATLLHNLVLKWTTNEKSITTDLRRKFRN